jgi:hypothetical protein
MFTSSQLIFNYLNIILDNLHVLASERDHARATFKAHTSTDRVVSIKKLCNLILKVKNKVKVLLLVVISKLITT